MSQMTSRQPVIFVSHGAPDSLLKAPSSIATWSALARLADKPRAVLALSAHWEADLPTVSAAPRPETIHDFGGFDPRLYRLIYPVNGAPELAQRVARRFAETGMALRTDAARGLDHGAWVPLCVMFPEADVPVTQLALPHGADATDLLAIGTVLRPLRDEGVMILVSGAITHNFGWLRWQEAESAQPLPRAREFADWVGDRVERADVQGLADYRQSTWGAEAHPSEEHFLPLFAALGAAGEDKATRHQPAFTYGGLAMDCYSWQ